MMRTWTRFGLAVLLAVPLTLAPLRADSDNAKSLADKNAELNRQLAELQKRYEDRLLEDNRRLTEENRRLKAQIDDMLAKMRDMEARLQPGRVSASYTPPQATTAPITLTNSYPAEATITINGQPYVVGPYQTRVIANQPLGPFNYSVSVEGYGLVRPATPATLTLPGHRINVFPQG